VCAVWGVALVSDRGETVSYEAYEVYVNSGEDDEKFREFMRTLPDAEISWKGLLR